MHPAATRLRTLWDSEERPMTQRIGTYLITVRRVLTVGMLLAAGVLDAQAQPQQPLRTRFNMPTVGESRFVPNEIILDSFPTVPTPTLEAIARRHNMTRLETQVFRLTGRRMHRWRLDGGGTVEAMIRGVNAEPLIAGAQPNYLYGLAQGAAAVTNQQYA